MACARTKNNFAKFFSKMVLGHRERCFKDAYLDGGYTLWVKTMELFLLTSIQILTDFLIIFPSALNERLPRLRTWFMTSWTKWCPRPYSKFAVILMIHGVWLFKARIQLGILEALNTANLHQGSVPRAGSGVVRMDPLRFLAGCRTRRLNQA